MPKRGRSGIPNLYKKHCNSCRNGDPLKCDCPWYAKYKHVNVNLARWSGQFVDPRRRQHAAVVMNRLRTSVDEPYFRAEGDYEVLGGKQTLGSFIAEWKEHYAKVHDLDFASIMPMLTHRPPRTRPSTCATPSAFAGDAAPLLQMRRSPSTVTAPCMPAARSVSRKCPVIR